MRTRRQDEKLSRALPLMVGLSLLATPGCSGSSDAVGPLATYRASDFGEGGDGALLRGKIDLRGGCVVVSSDDEGLDAAVDPVVPVVPDDYRWDADQDALVHDDGTVIRVGDSVDFGGGFAPQAPFGSSIPADCRADEYFVVHLVG